MLQHSAAFKRFAEKRPHIDATLLDPEAELEARERRRIQRPEPNEAYVGTSITKWNSSNRQNRQCHSVLNYFYHVSISDSSSKSNKNVNFSRQTHTSSWEVHVALGLFPWNPK